MNHPRNVCYSPRGPRMVSSDVDITVCLEASHLLWLVEFGHKPFLIACVCLGIGNLKIASGTDGSEMWHLFRKYYCQ